MPVIRRTVLATASALVLASCSLLQPPADASQGPSKPKDFCHAMQAAADAAAPAATSLDGLFDEIDTLATTATSSTDLTTLQGKGKDTVQTSQAYVTTLANAEELAPENLKADLDSLQQYWTLYVVGLATIASDTADYGDFVDQSSALQNSDAAAALIQSQPDAQQRINDGYLAECSG